MLFKITVLGDGGVGKTALTVQVSLSDSSRAHRKVTNHSSPWRRLSRHMIRRLRIAIESNGWWMISLVYWRFWIPLARVSFVHLHKSTSLRVEEYTALRDQWIRWVPLTPLPDRSVLIRSDGEGFLIVYSICQRSSFDRVERIIERVMRVKDETSPSSPTSASPYASYPGSPYSSAPGSSQTRRRIPIVIVGNKRDLYNNREVSTDEGKMLAQRMGCDFYETSAKQNANVEAAFKSLVRGVKVAKNGGDSSTVHKSRKKRHKGCVVL